MKRQQVFIWALCLLLFAACKVVSLHPLWNDETRVFDPSLTGIWKVAEEDSADFQLALESLGDTAYRFIYFSTDEKPSQSDWLDLSFLSMAGDTYEIPWQKMEFTANLVNLEGQYFFDLTPPTSQAAEDFAFLAWELNYLPVHTFIKVDRKGDQLRLSVLDDERLEDLFKQNRVRLSHETTSDWTVITASTRELQAFLRKYARDEAAFTDEAIWVKQ